MTSPPGKRLEHPLPSPAFSRRPASARRRRGAPCPALPRCCSCWYYSSCWSAALAPRLTPPPAAIWAQKPLLGYFVLTQSLAGEIERQGVLSPRQMALARRVARLQEAELQRLEQASLPVLLDPALTLEQKRQRIREMGYNRRVAEISATSQQLLALLLPARDTARFTAWAESRWVIERRSHGLASFTADPLSPNSISLIPNLLLPLPPAPTRSSPPATIRATVTPLPCRTSASSSPTPATACAPTTATRSTRATSST